MEVRRGSAPARASHTQLFSTTQLRRRYSFTPKVRPLNFLILSNLECQVRSSIFCVSRNASKRPLSRSSKGENKHRYFLGLTWSLSKRYSLKRERLIAHLRKFSFGVLNVAKYSEKFTNVFPILFLQLMVGVVLFMVVTVPVGKSLSWALTEENLLF